MTTTQLSPTFKMVLVVVIVFTSLSFVASVALSFTTEMEPVEEASLSTFKLGFGALVGLLGGKAI